jgi:hypothetical protein
MKEPIFSFKSLFKVFAWFKVIKVLFRAILLAKDIKSTDILQAQYLGLGKRG